jgi:hypothetical protein
MRPRYPARVELRTSARFPAVELEAGHYESFYLKAAHASEPLAIWIRYTVHKRPGQDPRGSVWFTLFEGGADGPRASKVTLPPTELGSGPDHYIRIGESRFEPGRVVGSAASDRLEASWELAFESSEPPFRHLPRGWMYRAPIPRTKLLSPYPAARFSGRVEVGERRVELDSWPGMVGHNWGAQHAERWIWLHGAAFEDAPDAWIDIAFGRIKLGPLTIPWIGNGVLSLEGVRHRLGGVERVRSTHVHEAVERCEFELAGSDLGVRGSVASERRNFVGWVYADPDGPEHNTVNCSIADMTLRLERDGRPDRTLELRGGAAYELGMRERDHGVPIQPFPDG